MKGLILAGGSGSRLFPVSICVNKQLLPVYDKPLIYYPLTILIAAGISEICIVSDEINIKNFKNIFKNGEDLGLSITYEIQEKPNGIAEGILIAEEFLRNDNFVLILGDNLFFGSNDFSSTAASFKSGAVVFGYHVSNPSDYGVVEFDNLGNAISIEEKPIIPKSNYAVPGIYFFDNQAIKFAKQIPPSPRGELEITDVLKEYMWINELNVKRLSRGFAWLDAGTSETLHEASKFIATIENRQGIKIGCPEEAAYQRKYISKDKLKELTEKMPSCSYKDYLYTKVLHYEL